MKKFKNAKNVKFCHNKILYITRNILLIEFVFVIIPLKGERKMSIKYNVIIQKEENWYVAKCLDNNVILYGY